MERHVIVGHGAAGVSAAEAIRKADPQAAVTMVSEEPVPSYSRVLLSYYLEGEVGEEELHWRGADIAARLGVELRLGKRAVALDPPARTLTLADGEELAYTKLLLATGARPQTAEVPGSGLAGIHTFRTLADARALRRGAEEAGRALVVGGGLVALKAACALRSLGLPVTLAVGSPQILSRNLDREGAALVRRHLEEQGLKFLTDETVAAFTGDRDGRVCAAVLQSGREFPCGLVVVGKGVQPQAELARGAGLEVRRGVVVGPSMETSHAGIYAAGDVAEGFDPLRGQYAVNAIWPSAVAQGRAAGRAMAGAGGGFCGLPPMNSVVFAGLPVIAAGVVEPEDPGCEVFTRLSPGDGTAKRVVLRDGRVVGLALVGDVATAGLLIGLMRAGTAVNRLKAHLLDDGLVHTRLSEAAWA